MTFDEGILTIYSLINTAQPGNKPKVELVQKVRCWYNYDNLGYGRYYTALQAQQKLEAVVNIPGWEEVEAEDICELENGKQYRIRMVQPTWDKFGLQITKLSLERWDGLYD
jgi:hypothetical protein